MEKCLVLPSSGHMHTLQKVHLNEKGGLGGARYQEQVHREYRINNI